MPLLSFPSPRHRASLIAALLLVELVAILWLRSSTAGDRDDGSWKAVEFLNRQVSEQPPPLDGPSSDHLGRRVEEGLELYAVKARIQDEKANKGSKWLSWRVSSGQNEQLADEAVRYRHHLPHRVNRDVENENSPSEHEQRSDTTTQSLSPTSTPSSNAEDVAFNSLNSKATEQPSFSKDNKKKAAKDKGKVKSGKKTKSKTREERKQNQLIPVVDENGVVIEDHFISLRDLDGDGTPDAYVLLRPTDNSKHMMDVGLFDEDTAAMALLLQQKPPSTLSPPLPPTPAIAPKPQNVAVPGSSPKPSSVLPASSNPPAAHQPSAPINPPVAHQPSASINPPATHLSSEQTLFSHNSLSHEANKTA